MSDFQRSQRQTPGHQNAILSKIKDRGNQTNCGFTACYAGWLRSCEIFDFGNFARYFSLSYGPKIDRFPINPQLLRLPGTRP
jgi:hypothetical protein